MSVRTGQSDGRQGEVRVRSFQSEEHRAENGMQQGCFGTPSIQAGKSVLYLCQFKTLKLLLNVGL